MAQSRNNHNKPPFRPKLAFFQVGALAASVFMAHNYVEQHSSSTQKPRVTEVANWPNEQPPNQIAEQMLQDVQPYAVIDFDEVMKHVDGTSNTFGEKISLNDIMRYMYAAGFRGQNLIIATSIAMRESVGGYPAAIGDVSYQGENRVSVGLAQITCGADGLPCEGSRDPRANMDPRLAAINMKNIYEQSISYYGYGEDSMGYDGRFNPWNCGQFDGCDKDSAQKTYMPLAQAAYSVMEQQYGDLSQ
ncbi:hypothetical protein BH10PAT3_BH10PAT3_7640 [soil metagenome]